jgi:hypothetical protein
MTQTTDEERADSLIGRLGTRDTVKGIIMLAFRDERERCAAIARRRSNHSGLHPIEDEAWQIAEEIERAGR